MNLNTVRGKLTASMFLDKVGSRAFAKLKPLQVIPVFWLGFLAVVGCGVTNSTRIAKPALVEAACGQCQFKMPGKGCDLAVRTDGHCYFVDGVHIDQLGDAHAADGFCNAIRQARVTGQIKNDRFVAASFELLPAK